MTILAIRHSTIRKEEKLIAEAANQRNIPLKLIDIRFPETTGLEFPGLHLA